MESQLQRDSQRAVQCEEQKSQLEEAIRKLQQDIREMRNTSEKYTASIQVRIPEPHTGLAAGKECSRTRFQPSFVFSAGIF